MDYAFGRMSCRCRFLTGQSNDEKASLEIRLEKIEAHLSSIARTRSIQMRNRKILLISLGLMGGALLIVELLAAIGALGRVSSPSIAVGVLLTCNAGTYQPVFLPPLFYCTGVRLSFDH